MLYDPYGLFLPSFPSLVQPIGLPEYQTIRMLATTTYHSHHYCMNAFFSFFRLRIAARHMYLSYLHIPWIHPKLLLFFSLDRLVYLASQFTHWLSCCSILCASLPLLHLLPLTSTTTKSQSLDPTRAYGTTPGDLSRAMVEHRYYLHYNRH